MVHAERGGSLRFADPPPVVRQLGDRAAASVPRAFTQRGGRTCQPKNCKGVAARRRWLKSTQVPDLGAGSGLGASCDQKVICESSKGTLPQCNERSNQQSCRDFKATDPGQKKFYWCPPASTIRNRKPFGEYVEGLSYCGAKTCFDEAAVQPDDFEDLTFLGVIRCKPLLAKSLRKFKHPGHQFGGFVS